LSAHTLPSVVGSNPPENRPINNAYYPALDGLRAVAFLMVFALHYLSRFLPISFGWAGVDIFFVLSGFLITGILYDTQNSPFRIRNFYLRRTLRIFPLYYAVFILLFLSSFVVHWNWNRLWLLWPAYLGNSIFLLPHPPFEVAQGTFLSQRWPWMEINFGHFWTLCVEEQFYLVWPWIVFGVRSRRRLIAICVAAIIFCPIARAFAGFYLPPAFIANEIINTATPFRVDALLFGALIALLLRGPSARRLSFSTPFGVLLMTLLLSI
jgi:peptidoglycan/LPS O-acetylase OafA/YrhL